MRELYHREKSVDNTEQRGRAFTDLTSVLGEMMATRSALAETALARYAGCGFQLLPGHQQNERQRDRPTFVIESPGFLIEGTYPISLRSRGKEGEV